MAEPAPIALFVFRRPEHTGRVLAALERCPEFHRSPLHVFADSPRLPKDESLVAETRAVVAGWPHDRKTVTHQLEPKGLARSIIAGVSELCDRYGRVIVVEDDLLVHPGFLTYMNCALETFADEERVLSVNAYNFGDCSAASGGRSFFLRYCHPWGWATWKRAWDGFDPARPFLAEIEASRAAIHGFNLQGADDYRHMLAQQVRGRIDSWWIRWYAHTYLSDRLGLFPPRSLVQSIGADRSATHGQYASYLLRDRRPETVDTVPPLPERIGVEDHVHRSFRAGMRPTARRIVRGLGRIRSFLRDPR